MNKLLLGFVLAAIVIVVGLSLAKNPVTGSTVSEEPAKTFVVTGDHLRFFIDGIENPDMIVEKGDRVRVEFQSTEGFHDWVVDEFGAATERVTGNQTTSVEFVADKAGTFEYYCSVGQHRANGMFGKFIVE